LFQLWSCWRDALGLPVSAPFAEHRLGMRRLPSYKAMTKPPASPADG
jgi:hypothetical protein